MGAAGTCCGLGRRTRMLCNRSPGGSSSMREGTAWQTWTSISRGGCASGRKPASPLQRTAAWRRQPAAGREAGHPTARALVRGRAASCLDCMQSCCGQEGRAPDQVGHHDLLGHRIMITGLGVAFPKICCMNHGLYLMQVAGRM